MFFLNNKPIVFYKEYRRYTIIRFCDHLNIHIPRFCYHSRLSVAGNCRMCLVEVSNSIKPVIACATLLMPRMSIFLDSLLVKKVRESVLEFLLINHPLDCPICDQGGECDLQEQTLTYGSDRSRFQEMKRSVSDKDLGPIVKTIMTRCIHCTRCIRFSDEVLGLKDLGLIGRGSSVEVKMNNLFFLDSELSGNIVDICPVGALTSKPFAFTCRPWELKSVESIDVLDSLHSNIRLDLKENKILRILPRLNLKLNENWISDFTRFSYESVQEFRIKHPYLCLHQSFFSFLETSVFIRMGWEQCIVFFRMLKSLKNFDYLTFFLSPRIGLFNSNFFYFISRFIKNSNFLIESIPTFNIDNRNTYFVEDFAYYVKSNYFLYFDLNIKNNFSVFQGRIQNYLAHSFYKRYFFYIGSYVKHSYSIYHLGTSLITLSSLLRGKNLNGVYFFKMKIKKLNFNLFSSDLGLVNFLNNLNIFHEIKLNNLIYHSNVSGYFDFGLNSDLISNDTFFKEKNNFSYFYKTNTIDLNNSFFAYHGNYLPLAEEISAHSNYIYLPSTSIFEEEDSFINLFGDLQGSHQSVSLIDKEDVRTDFYILSNLLTTFFFSFTKKELINNYYCFDLIYNELVFYYINYFCTFFDIFPHLSNYNYNTLKCLKNNNVYFFKHFISNLTVRDSFFVNYSSTLRNFYKLRDSRNLSSFC
jgi:NADH-quinone oxidoreductase chain G